MQAMSEGSIAPIWSAAMAPAPDSGWPLLAMPVTAGVVSPADDRIERRLSLDEHLVRIPEATFLARVSGDALADAGIRDGDLLVMDRAAPATTDSIALVMVAGQCVLARVSRDASGRRVLCGIGVEGGDPALDEEMAIIAVARWTIHRLWPGRNATY